RNRPTAGSRLTESLKSREATGKLARGGAEPESPRRGASHRLPEDQPVSPMRTRYTRSPIVISACSPSPTSRRYVPTRSFHRTAAPARQVGATLDTGNPARRELRWLFFRGSPAGKRALPDIDYLSPSFQCCRV